MSILDTRLPGVITPDLQPDEEGLRLMIGDFLPGETEVQLMVKSEYPSIPQRFAERHVQDLTEQIRADVRGAAERGVTHLQEFLRDYLPSLPLICVNDPDMDMMYYAVVRGLASALHRRLKQQLSGSEYAELLEEARRDLEHQRRESALSAAAQMEDEMVDLYIFDYLVAHWKLLSPSERQEVEDERRW